ncbi:Glucan endo-1 [Forsythia ovata]|uniref:Glucan endo-1 n=1 Tax=Forsythia ovata TaxID=205694 RepID=A0ABD1X2P8_9LAMI
MERLCVVLFTIACILSTNSCTRAIGVNYGFLGDNLPTPANVVALLKSRNIQKIRIFNPNPDVLTALGGSGIEVVLGVRNENLEELASDATAAARWVNINVTPYKSSVKFTYISAGNEVIPGPLAGNVLGAMQNLDAALNAANSPIPVSTVVPMQVLDTSFPPSNGKFSDETAATMQGIVGFLTAKKAPLLLNAYPFFAHTGDPTNVPLDYALFVGNSAGINDGSLHYTNLLDAMVDSVYSALEKVGGSTVDIVVSETGWPSAGNTDAAVENAKTYTNNLVSHVASGQGTPKRPGKALETYIFAMFNENLKPAGVERNFGLYYPDMTEVYHVNFPSS